MSGVAGAAGLAIGRTSRGRPVRLDFMRAAHVLVQGQTRSGKSVLAYRLIAGLVATEGVLIVGCDPSGVLLGPLRRLAGAEMRSVTNRRVAAHAEVLQALVAVLDARVDELLASGSDALRSFDSSRPLIVVVLEELPGMLAALEADDAAAGRRGLSRYAAGAHRDFRRLVQEGAKVGSGCWSCVSGRTQPLSEALSARTSACGSR